MTSLRTWLGVAALALFGLATEVPASAQQGPGDCAPGWVFANGQCVPPSRDTGGRNDAACQATAQFNYCQASAYVGCTSLGSVFACRLLQLSRQNPGLFQGIMNAQRACLLDRNQQACGYLQRFRGTYF